MLETQNNHYEIFVASRFEEFKDLRSKLVKNINQYRFMKAIDLNNNEASTRSPLTESLFYAKKSEIMILLVGETYGTIPDGEEFSYTHLEYKEAIKENSNTRVLVFCIGNSYKSIIEYSNDSNMANWQKELEKNHRIRKFENIFDLEEIVEKISIDLLTSLYELNLIDNEDLKLDVQDLQTIESNVDDEFLLEDNDSKLLDTQYQEDEEIKLTVDENEKIEGFALLRIPNKLAALEQKYEAQYAIDIRDYSTAIKHLQKALDLKPLDFETNYWLAKLYVTSAKKSLFYEIEEYLLRAAKIAEKNNNIYRASYCYLLIVQASIFSDKRNEGEKYIRLAEELTRSFAKVYYMKSKFLFSFGENINAKKAIDECLKIKMDFLEQYLNDPFFMPYKLEIAEHFKEMKNKLYKTTEGILHNTNMIRSIFNIRKFDFTLTNYSIIDLWKNARKGIMGQYNIIFRQLDAISNKSLNLYDTKKRELKNSFDSEILKIDRSYESSVNKINVDEKTDIDKLTKITNEEVFKINLKRKNILYITAVSFILSIFLFLNGANYEIPTFFSISGIFGLMFLYNNLLLIKKTKENHEIELKSFNEICFNKIDELSKEKENKKIDLEDNYKDSLKLVDIEINKYQDDVDNIRKALEIFETKSLTLSEAKFIPFKSLNKAKNGAIIRVHKYSRKLDSDLEIELLEDFPDEYHIDKIFDDNNIKHSFLAKVKNKFKNSVVLSRSEAYRS
jgi:hypothetical protein